MKTFALGLAAAFLACAPASAAVITSLPGGQAQAMPAVDYHGAGPQTFGDGITWRASYFDSFFGWDGAYGFGMNGFWTGGPIAGVNGVGASMTFTFDAPISAFLVDLNWIPGQFGGVHLRAYDAADAKIGILELSGDAGNLVAPGAYGFGFDTDRIVKIEFDGGYIGARDLSIARAVSAAPEPGTWALLILGFAAAGTALRRRRPAFGLGVS